MQSNYLNSERSKLLAFASDSDFTISSLNDDDWQRSIWCRIKAEVEELLDITIPTLQGLVFLTIPWLISLRFVGEIGADELAAAAMANTICNVTGLSLSEGLSSALTTLSGQAKGDLISREGIKEHRRPTLDSFVETGTLRVVVNTETEPITPIVYFWRGIIVLLSIVLPVALWWLVGVKDTLVSLGQTEKLSIMTSAYLRILAPSLIGYSINWTLTAWLQSIGMADVPAKASILGLILHSPFNYLFVHILEYGYLGCALATVCLNLVQPMFITWHLLFYKYGQSRLLESTGGIAIGRTRLTFWREFRLGASSIEGYRQYLSLALPGIIMITEWWASEVAVILAGRFEPNPQVAVAAMSIYQSLNTFCYVWPMAFAIAATARIGNLLGAGKPQEAAFASVVSFGCTVIVCTIISTVLFSIPHDFFPSLFAPEAEDVIVQASRTIPLLVLYVFADGIQAVLSGIISGCGRQVVTVPIVLVSYWVLGVPFAYYTTFVVSQRALYCDDFYFCGDVGLVSGMTLGTWVHMVLLGIVVVTSTDWEMEAEKAKERVKTKRGVLESLME